MIKRRFQTKIDIQFCCYNQLNIFQLEKVNKFYSNWTSILCNYCPANEFEGNFKT